MTDLSAWTKRPTPGIATLSGERVRLEPLDWSAHASGLFAAVGGAANAGIWEWMPVGPLALNDEVTLMVLDSKFGQQMEAIFKDDLSRAVAVDPVAFGRRSIIERIKEWGANQITRVL